MLRKAFRGRVVRAVMNRRVFLLSSAGSLLLSSPVLAAASHEDEVARTLVGQGFAITGRSRTLLGRVRFTAAKGETQREVVVDPSSGEILRDYYQRVGGAKIALRAGDKEGLGAAEGASGGDESPAGGGEPSQVRGGITHVRGPRISVG
jgi:hypothetical protein